ncbi:ANTAR domain-containing protein [Streptomyces populi]
MARHRCTANIAFGILRSASPHRDMKLRDLCTEVITSLTGQAPVPPQLPHIRRSAQKPLLGPYPDA